MATHLYEHRAQPPRSRLAWLASLAVHGAMLALLAYVSWRSFRGTPAGVPSREEGVVLGLADLNSADEVSEAPAAALRDPQSAADDLGESLVGDLAAARPAPVVQPSRDALLTPKPEAPNVTADNPASAEPAVAAPPRRTGSVRYGQYAERATVSVFGARGEGTRFVYLFDRSTSMAGAPLAAAKQQLLGSLDALSSVHQFQVIFFNHAVQAWDLTGGQRRVPFASDSNKRLAAGFVNSVVAAGGTNRLTALRRALALDADVVFFLTDADDAMPAYDVAEVIDRAERSGTAIACIEFGAGPQPEGGNFLTQIAAATRGDYVYVDVTKLGGR
jgi:hypothetical protein